MGRTPFTIRLRSFIVLVAVTLIVAVAGCSMWRKEVWIYTSLSQEVIDELAGPLSVAVSGADIKWFHGTSEAVMARFNAEQRADKPKADLLIAGEPWVYADLKRNDLLLPYSSPAAVEVPANFRDPDGAFTSVRVQVIVIGYNPKLIVPSNLPQRWTDLTQSTWRGRVSMGSPFDSAAQHAATAVLSKTYGWEYFAALRAGGLVAEGGSGAVIERILSGERPVGIVLLENVLKAQANGGQVAPLYPLDGVIPLPGFVAIMRQTRHPEIVKKVYDGLFSAVAQNVFVSAGMYSALPKIVSPDRARPWRDLSLQMMRWDAGTPEQLARVRDLVRAKFSEVVLREVVSPASTKSK